MKKYEEKEGMEERKKERRNESQMKKNKQTNKQTNEHTYKNRKWASTNKKGKNYLLQSLWLFSVVSRTIV